MSVSAAIVGLNNPDSDRPRDALVPWPGASTGARLVEYMRAALPEYSADDYLEDFDRFNLWPGRELPTGRGAGDLYLREGRKLRRTLIANYKRVALLGSRAWYSVLLRDPPLPFEAQEVAGTHFWYVPHPSGLNRFYNDSANRVRAGEALLLVSGRAFAETDFRSSTK